jgi:hypothetical protein
MYYEVVVEVQTEQDNGKVKKSKEYYLTEAVSVTDAEATVYKDMEGEECEWKVISSKESKILKVLKNAKK